MVPDVGEELERLGGEREPRRHQRATVHEGEGLGEESPPGAAPLGRDGRPLPEASPGGANELGAAGGDELVDPCLGQLDEEVAGATVAAGEEGAVDAQAGKAHHRRALDAGLGEQRFGERPRTWLRRGVGAVMRRPSSAAVGTRSAASASGPGRGLRRAAASRPR